MGNFFNNGPTFLKLIVRVRISYINKHLEKKIVDLKTGFLRIFFWTFIEVKWTIQIKILSHERDHLDRKSFYLFCTK
jgi:hypothetical protein